MAQVLNRSGYRYLIKAQRQLKWMREGSARADPCWQLAFPIRIYSVPLGVHTWWGLDDDNVSHLFGAHVYTLADMGKRPCYVIVQGQSEETAAPISMIEAVI